MTYLDYGTPTDTLASPSLSEWAASVAAELASLPARDGGVWTGSASVASSTGANNTITVAGTPTVWGSVTSTAAGLTIAAPGWYQVTVNGTFATNGAGTIRSLSVFHNGAAMPAGFYAIGAVTPPTAATSGGLGGVILSGSGMWPLAAGDTLSVRMRQDSGGALTGSATLSVQLIH